jgi:hypothetical protein
MAKVPAQPSRADGQAHMWREERGPGAHGPDRQAGAWSPLEELPLQPRGRRGGARHWGRRRRRRRHRRQEVERVPARRRLGLRRRRRRRGGRRRLELPPLLVLRARREVRWPPCPVAAGRRRLVLGADGVQRLHVPLHTPLLRPPLRLGVPVGGDGVQLHQLAHQRLRQRRHVRVHDLAALARDRLQRRHLPIERQTRQSDQPTHQPTRPAGRSGGDDGRMNTHLGGELVDVEGDAGDGLGGALGLAGPALLQEALGLGGGVLQHHHLGPVLDAGHVQERLGVPLLVLVHHLLVVRVQARLLRHQLLQLACVRSFMTSPALHSVCIA